MSDDPMTCSATEKLLEAYVAGDLTPEAENRMARHLTGCSKCAAEAGLAARVGLELAVLPSFDAPPELIARIKSAATDELAPVVALASRRPRRYRRSTALAATLLAALAIGWWQVARDAPPSVAEIEAAEQEARYALALVARIGRKAGAEVRDEVFVERVALPVLKSMGRPLERDHRDVAAKTGGMKS